MNPLAAALLSAAMAAVGVAFRALTPGGGAAAAAVGTAILAATGWPGALVLFVFFGTSSAISRLPAFPPGSPRNPSLPASPTDAKGPRRDARQVLANGGAAAAGALLGAASAPGATLWIVTAALAAAAGDTWATSVGGLSRSAPRLILGGTLVATGTSGGVTRLGTLGGAAGALVTALAGWAGARWLGGPPAGPGGTDPRLTLPVAAVLAMIGIAGMLADSALGAGLQGRFHCPACDLPSEWPRHRCGTTTVPRGGLPWLDNDGVNALATVFAAALAFTAWLWWR